MAKSVKPAESTAVEQYGMRLTIEVSPQAYSLLRQLLSRGVYGLTLEGVVERIVDERLREFLPRSGGK